MGLNTSWDIWYPGEKGYKEHRDRLRFSNNQIGAIKDLQNELMKNGTQYANHSESIIASNEQIINVLESSINKLSVINENGFNKLSSDLGHIAEINERGFESIVSAVENLHSDMNYYFDLTVQRLEFQISLLGNILNTLQAPIESIVKEYYKKGCLFIQQENLELALEYFNESISAKMGKDFFHSQFQIGRLYLNGFNEEINLIDLALAQDHLTKANKLGNGIVKMNNSFKPILADCKLFLSQTYYYQLTGNKTKSELDLLKEAITYCEESIKLNLKLSQAFYHCAKYISYGLTNFNEFNTIENRKKLLYNFEQAVLLDRNYLRSLVPNDIFYDKVFANNKNIIFELVTEMTNRIEISAINSLTKSQKEIDLIDKLGVTKADETEFDKAKKIANNALKDYNSKTYFGFYDCIIKLRTL